MRSQQDKPLKRDKRLAKKHLSELDQQLRNDFCDYLSACRERIEFEETKAQLTESIINVSELVAPRDASITDRQDAQGS